MKNQKYIPRELVINFARDHLVDPEINFEELQRMSLHLSFNELWYATKKEQLSISQTIDLILCKLSKTYLHRERIQKRILSTIPNYKSSIREIK